MKTAELNRLNRRFATLDSIDPNLVIPRERRHEFGIDNVGVGGVIAINGERFVVQATATYQETDDKYKKDKGYLATELVLFSLKTAQTRYIEYARDDGLEISFTERKIPRRELGSDLRYDDGEVVNLEDADEIVEEEWDLVFGGQTYHYDDDWACRFESSDGRKFFAYMYEFESDSGDYLTIEAWSETGKESDEWEYEVFLSRPLGPEQIEVISLGRAA